MSELQIIQATLARAARRRRVERGLRGLFVGLFVGALFLLVALAVVKLAPVSPNIVRWSGGAPILCPLVGFILGFWRKPSLAETARWVDVKQNLKERMSTALEVAETQPPGTWRDLVMHDAASHAQEIEPRKLVPFSITKAARWAAVVLVFAAGLGFVPEYRSKASIQKQTDAKVIKEAGKQVAELTKRINALEVPLESLSDEQLKAKTTEFKLRHQKGETLDNLLPEAFAVVQVDALTFLFQHSAYCLQATWPLHVCASVYSSCSTQPQIFRV